MIFVAMGCSGNERWRNSPDALIYNHQSGTWSILDDDPTKEAAQAVPIVTRVDGSLIDGFFMLPPTNSQATIATGINWDNREGWVVSTAEAKIQPGCLEDITEPKAWIVHSCPGGGPRWLTTRPRPPMYRVDYAPCIVARDTGAPHAVLRPSASISR